MNAARRGVDNWLLAGYVGTAGFLVQELFLRQSGTAASLNASHEDEGTTRLLLTSSGLALGLPLLLRRLPLPLLPPAAAIVGISLQVSGLTLRVWSMSTLGAFYTRTLRTTADQHVVDTGPYRMIRHPGYSGALLIWIGLSLAARSTPAAFLIPALMGRAYRRRITAEENLLQHTLSGYDSYRRRTRKLIPLAW